MTTGLYATDLTLKVRDLFTREPYIVAAGLDPHGSTTGGQPSRLAIQSKVFEGVRRGKVQSLGNIELAPPAQREFLAVRVQVWESDAKTRKVGARLAGLRDLVDRTNGAATLAAAAGIANAGLAVRILGEVSALVTERMMANQDDLLLDAVLKFQPIEPESDDAEAQGKTWFKVEISGPLVERAAVVAEYPGAPVRLELHSPKVDLGLDFRPGPPPVQLDEAGTDGESGGQEGTPDADNADPTDETEPETDGEEGAAAEEADDGQKRRGRNRRRTS